MPAHGLPVVEVDTGTVSKGSTETHEVVRQDRVVLQGVCCDRQDCWELQGLQEALSLETVEVLQTGCREAWLHVEESHLGPKVGVDKVVEGQSRHCRLHHHCWGRQLVVRDWVVEKPLREEVRNWEGFCTTEGAFQRGSPIDDVFALDLVDRVRRYFGFVVFGILCMVVSVTSEKMVSVVWVIGKRDSHQSPL